MNQLQFEYDNLKQVYEQLKRNLRKLKDEKLELAEKVKLLEIENGELKERIEGDEFLECRLQSVIKTNTELQKNELKWQEDFKNLRQLIRFLNEENRKLRAELGRLQV